MASSDTLKEVQIIPAEKPALQEFKAGVVKSMKQYNAGLVKTFDNVDDFLADLHNTE
jgi:hypothetical protein